MNKKKNDIRVCVNPKYFGKRLYVFTKDSKKCIAVEYNPTHDYGKGSSSGARIESNDNRVKKIPGISKVTVIVSAGSWLANKKQ